MSSLRVGLVAHAELGGSGAVAVDLATGLARRGHAVHMITPRRPFRLAGEEGVAVHEIEATSHPMWESAPWSLALACRIADVAEQHDLDVIHAHFALPYAVATELAGRMLGVGAPPWIATLHGSDVDPLGRDPAYARIIRFALERADRLTVPSHYLAARARELFPALPLEVIPNFVDGGRFAPAADRTPPSRGAVLVHASNLRRVKRIGDVIDIFARVAAEIPARLLLVGDGPERAPMLARAEALGVRDRIEAPGAVTDVERWIARGHVALVPSERESFGLAALEALACGVPVVGSAVGGLAEVVEHGATGALAEVGDVDAMARAALLLLGDDDGWAAASQNARARALSRFSTSEAINSYVTLYRSLAGTSFDDGRAGAPSSPSAP